MQQAPPPGWYDDPNGHGRRWWDGSRWTDHTERAAPAAAPGPVTDEQARNWAMAAHLSALVSMFIGFAFIGPLVVYLIKKDEHPFIRAQAAEALNFNLSWLVWGVVLGIVFFITAVLIVGLALLPVIILGAIAWLVLVIMAGVRAGKGESFRYPLTIRLID